MYFVSTNCYPNYEQPRQPKEHSAVLLIAQKGEINLTMTLTQTTTTTTATTTTTSIILTSSTILTKPLKIVTLTTNNHVSQKLNIKTVISQSFRNQIQLFFLETA